MSYDRPAASASGPPDSSLDTDEEVELHRSVEPLCSVAGFRSVASIVTSSRLQKRAAETQRFLTAAKTPLRRVTAWRARISAFLQNQ